MPPRNTPGNELVESRQTDDPRFGQAWSMPQHRPTFTFSISSCVSNHVSTKAGQAQGCSYAQGGEVLVFAFE